jgi:nucleoside phosphorylase
MSEWESWMSSLTTSGDDVVDDVVDELAARILGSPPDPSASAVGIKALQRARSDLSCRSAALALAYVAGGADLDAPDALCEAYASRRSNAFLGPSMLFSLGLLSLSNEDARAATLRLLLRLKPEDDPRPLLVAGARVAGLLIDREDRPDLRRLLVTLGASDDPAIRAEGLFQFALLRFADALAARDHQALIASLRAAGEAFRTVEASDESRPDARLFRLLIEASLEFDALEVDRVGTAHRIGALIIQLRQLGRHREGSIFQMDRSPAASQVSDRCIGIASSLEDAATEVADGASWTNFDLTVTTLAQCYSVVRYNPHAYAGNRQAVEAFSQFGDRILKKRLGPVLARKIGRESFARVVANYEARNGKDGLSSALLVLQQASLDAERAEGFRLSESSVGLLSELAERAGCTPDELIRRFNLRITSNGGDGAAVAMELMPSPPGQRAKKMPLPTIGIIVALTEEFDAVRAMIPSAERYRAPGSGGGREYLLGDIPSLRKGAHQVVVAQTMDMGNTSAATRASKMLMDFDGIEHIIMCGIAGGVPHPSDPQEHVRLGDIVVSNRKGVIQYDFGKQKGKVFEERFAPRPPSARLLEAVQVLEQDRLSDLRPWDVHIQNGLKARSLVIPNADSDVILDDKGKRIEHPPATETRPRVILGPIASANVVQGDFRKRDRLRDDHKVKAVEMEGYGIADATWEFERAGYLVVRGICDYCDVRTKHLQTDAWKRHAAMVAAGYVRALIEAMPGLNTSSVVSPVAAAQAAAAGIWIETAPVPEVFGRGAGNVIFEARLHNDGPNSLDDVVIVVQTDIRGKLLDIPGVSGRANPQGQTACHLTGPLHKGTVIPFCRLVRELGQGEFSDDETGRPRPWIAGSLRFLVYSRGLDPQSFVVDFDNDEVKRAVAKKAARS